MNFIFKMSILISIILCVSYYNTYTNSYIEKFNSSANIEKFNSSATRFVLLGDSILKNDKYVVRGKSVNDLFMERTDNKTLSFAKDDSKITDVYSQLESMLSITESANPTIFLSIGGNDILFHFVENNGEITDTTVLDGVFSEYKKLLKQIIIDFPESPLVVLDIYYPNNATYSKYHQIIQKWNQKLYEYATKNNISVVKISSYLTQAEDFTHGIEPSEIGGDKLVTTLLSEY